MQQPIALLIKEEAKRIGFSACGIAKPEYLGKQKQYLTEWIEKKYHAGMKYMEATVENRTDPHKLFDEVKSIVVVSLDYNSSIDLSAFSGIKISRYALGKDYHIVMKQKLNLLLGFIKENCHGSEGKIFVDTAAVMEKVWAEKAGIGWIGKNTLHINKNNGSFHFLGVLMLNIPMDADKPSTNLCGDCQKCLETCPTNALVAPYVLEAGKCLSYITIESKKEIEPETAKKSKGWIFGCDLCQNVCPWNITAEKKCTPDFEPLKVSKDLLEMGFASLNESEFSEKFRYSPIGRANFHILKKNTEKIIHHKYL